MNNNDDAINSFDWVEEAKKRGIGLTARQIEQFAQYEALLLEWNHHKINLTAVTDPTEIRRRHFLDSLTCTAVLGPADQAPQTLIDVGTGGGFPGLPLKIFYPSWSVTLADSVAKKTHFLQIVIDELGLEGVTVVADRAETLGQSPQFRERFDWVVARSVAEMRVLAEYLLPLARVGGRVLAQKGENAPQEIDTAQKAIALLGGDLVTFHDVQLPGHLYKHHLVELYKREQTPAKYPRQPGKPRKRPLG